MQHASRAHLIDAIRGVLADESHLAFDRHIGECAACAEELRFWQRFAAAVEQDALFEPPPAAVRAVEGQIAGSPFEQSGLVERSLRGVRALAATLTVDTLQQSLPVAVRACASGTRQLLYDVSPLSLDLRLESGRAQRILMTGQLASATDPAGGGRDASVAVLSTGGKVAAVRANEFGEFHCEFDRRRDLVLAISLTDGRQIVLPLDRLPIPAHEDDAAPGEATP